MAMDLRELIAHSNMLFGAKKSINSLWQTLATHFYYERADFTNIRQMGSELSDGMVDSYPALMRRDLGNSFGAMLREGEDWFKIVTKEQVGWDARQWLQQSTSKLAGRMYTRGSNFTRATREGDHDYATFGNAVISVEPNKNRDGLLYRCWHLRDCAWEDDECGMVGQVHRKWCPTVWELKKYFGEDALHDVHKEHLRSNKPMTRVNIRHVVMSAEQYGKDELSRYKYVSLFFDVDQNHMLLEQGLDYQYYVVPRFQTIAGSPYAYSPATVVGLPNARALQAMTHTLLEAAERMARPPIIATSRVVNSSVDLGPDGITWVDDKYDEKLGASMRPLFQDKSGFPVGQDMRESVVEVLASAFYLDKLNLPPADAKMTAYEVSERMKQFRREVLPLFSPIEMDYNGQLCEASFDIALRFNLLGPVGDVPIELQGQDVDFEFRSPIRGLDERKKVTQFRENAELLAIAAEMDPSVRANYDHNRAFRDAVAATESPLTWLRSMEEVLQIQEQERAGQAAQELLAAEQAVPGLLTGEGAQAA